MSLLSVTLSLILLFLNQQQFTEAFTLSPVIILRDGEVGVCPNQEKRDVISDEVVNILRDSAFVRNCGEGLWYRVAYLNMSDPSQQCPSSWREFNSNGIRTCARPISNTGSCPGNIYSVNHQYSRVCGRLFGYQIGSTDAFYPNLALTTDEIYLDGVSITRGMPREHVWSYVAAASEQGTCGGGIRNCPCSPGGPAPPSFVGNNFYCESAYQGDCFETETFFANDTLWDGQQCNNEGTCCTGDGANTPPWFSVAVSKPTSDDIEVRICHDQSTSSEELK